MELVAGASVVVLVVVVVVVEEGEEVEVEFAACRFMISRWICAIFSYKFLSKFGCLCGESNSPIPTIVGFGFSAFKFKSLFPIMIDLGSWSDVFVSLV